MNDLINLNEVSIENRAKILEILAQERNNAEVPKNLEQKELDDFFAKTRMSDKAIPPTNKPKALLEIEIDNAQIFEENINKIGPKMKEKRLDGKLDHHDIETYRQLEIIHENGVPNFWARVKNVVDRKVEIRPEDVSDVVSDEDLGI